MTDNTKSISDQGLRYTSPRVKVVEVKAQHMLCGSLDGTPSNSPWTPGSDSAYGFGDDED